VKVIGSEKNAWGLAWGSTDKLQRKVGRVWGERDSVGVNSGEKKSPVLGKGEVERGPGCSPRKREKKKVPGDKKNHKKTMKPRKQIFRNPGGDGDVLT